MRPLFFSLSTVLAALLLSTISRAQTEQMDTVTAINGEATDAVTRKYFNAANCADPPANSYDLTLTNAGGVTRAYLWAGRQNAGCEEVENRSDQLDVCREIAGNPQTVGDNGTMTGLGLQDLVDTGIVDCENTALEGQTYWIYSFRDEDPGGGSVGLEAFGVAELIVDVTPPDQLSLDSQPVQEGSSFSVAWDSPDDSQKIPEYRLYASATDDPDAALAGGVVKRTTIDQKSISVTTGELGLSSGDEVYLFASAVDEASVTVGNGNEGPLSESTLGIAAETNGFCDDPNVDCSGCSASHLVLPNGQPSAGLWMVGLVAMILVIRRLFS